MSTSPTTSLASADFRTAAVSRLPRRRDVRFEQHFRDLAFQLPVMRSTSPDRSSVVGITACSRRAGVSTIATNLAMALAGSAPGRCLLVDANFQMASLHKLYGVEDSPGLLEIIADNVPVLDCVYRVPSVANLFFLPTGNTRQNSCPADPLVVTAALAKIQEHFNFVVLDLPPANEPNDVLPLAAAADAVILVVESERVRRQVALRTRQRLLSGGANLIGTVLSKRRKYIPSFVYRSR